MLQNFSFISSVKITFFTLFFKVRCWVSFISNFNIVKVNMVWHKLRDKSLLSVFKWILRTLCWIWIGDIRLNILETLVKYGHHFIINCWLLALFAFQILTNLLHTCRKQCSNCRAFCRNSVNKLLILLKVPFSLQLIIVRYIELWWFFHFRLYRLLRMFRTHLSLHVRLHKINLLLRLLYLQNR